MLLALLDVGRIGGMGGGKPVLGFQPVQPEQSAQFVLFGVGELRAVAFHHLQGGKVGVVFVEFVEDAAEFAVEAAIGGFEVGGAARRLPVEKGQQFLANGGIAVRLLDEAPEPFQSSSFAASKLLLNTCFKHKLINTFLKVNIFFLNNIKLFNLRVGIKFGFLTFLQNSFDFTSHTTNFTG